MNKHASRLVKAYEGWKEGLSTYTIPPEGMFGRVAIVESVGVLLNSKELDLEFTVEFDDNLEADEAEIKVYNLSKTTIEGLKRLNKLTITAGYNNDTGVIFVGYIDKVRTKWEGVDKVTTIIAYAYVGDSTGYVVSKTYERCTKASYILKDLIVGYMSPPLTEFAPRRDHVYLDPVTVEGTLWEEIQKYAEVCGISVYLNNGKIYARHITDGDNINFTVSQETGLIGSPEEFEEEIKAEDYKDTIKGYKFKMLLQYRMTTAAIISLKSREVSGKYRVRSGKHIFNESESLTELEVI